MPDALGGPSASTLLRWSTFIVVEANVAFMYAFVNRTGDLPSITEVSQQYATTFAPAHFVNAICWIIGIAVLLFFVAALWPRRRPTGVYDPFIVPLAMASTLGSAWVVAFRYDQLDVVVALTAAGVVLGALMFARAAALRSPRARLLRVPFALIFGWATVALLTTTAQWFNARGWLTTIELVTEMSLGFLALAAVLGAFVALRYREFVYPTGHCLGHERHLRGAAPVRSHDRRRRTRWVHRIADRGRFRRRCGGYRAVSAQGRGVGIAQSGKARPRETRGARCPAEARPRHPVAQIPPALENEAPTAGPGLPARSRRRDDAVLATWLAPCGQRSGEAPGERFLHSPLIVR